MGDAIVQLAQAQQHEGSHHKGSDHKGSSHKGSDHKGSNHKGSSHKGSSHKGSSMKGSTSKVGEDGEIYHTMDGVPVSMAIGSIIAIILVSHLALHFRAKIASKFTWRYDLLKFKPFKAMILKRGFPLAAQSISIVLFVVVVWAGFWGSQRVNIAPVITWTLWWVMLIFFVLGFGKVFCTICPWEGLASLFSSLSLRSRKKVLGFEKQWPKWLHNIYPALFLFILLTWFELGLNITRSPSMTALMALIYLGIAILFALVFKRRTFCRYVCLVGRIQGLYALFSPVELRPKSLDPCRTCAGKDCYQGNETSTGCPTFLFPGNLKENTYCTLCTECVRACPHDNFSINIRPFAEDLMTKRTYKWDEAVMAIVLLALSSFHGLTMTPQWNRMTDSLRVDLDLGLKPVFTLLMIAMTLAPLLLFWASACFSKLLVKSDRVSVGKLFKAFAYSVIPVALFYHLAHNGMHFFMEAQNLIPLLSDPLGQGWDLFGTAGKTYPGLLSLSAIWWLQITLIIIGHVFGVLVADRIAKDLFKDKKEAALSLLPLILTMILYSGFSVWLIAQPMEMRTGM